TALALPKAWPAGSFAQRSTSSYRYFPVPTTVMASLLLARGRVAMRVGARRGEGFDAILRRRDRRCQGARPRGRGIGGGGERATRPARLARGGVGDRAG